MITLTDAKVVAVTVLDDNVNPTEPVSFACQKIEIDYYLNDSGTPTIFKWDLKTNTV